MRYYNNVTSYAVLCCKSWNIQFLQKPWRRAKSSFVGIRSITSSTGWLIFSSCWQNCIFCFLYSGLVSILQCCSVLVYVCPTTSECLRGLLSLPLSLLINASHLGVSGLLVGGHLARLLGFLADGARLFSLSSMPLNAAAVAVSPLPVRWIAPGWSEQKTMQKG